MSDAQKVITKIHFVILQLLYSSYIDINKSAIKTVSIGKLEKENPEKNVNYKQITCVSGYLK